MEHRFKDCISIINSVEIDDEHFLLDEDKFEFGGGNDGDDYRIASVAVVTATTINRSPIYILERWEI